MTQASTDPDPSRSLPQDTPVARATIDTLSDETIDQLIEEKQELRLKYQREWEAAQLARQNAQASKLRDSLDKQINMFKREIDATDKKLEKLQERALKIRALRIQLGDVKALQEEF